VNSVNVCRGVDNDIMIDVDVNYITIVPGYISKAFQHTVIALKA